MSKRKHWSKSDRHAGDEKARYEHPIPSRHHLLETLEKLGAPTSLEALAEALELTLERDQQALDHRLRAMVRDGQIIRNRRHEFCLLKELPLSTGRVSGHRDGFGFVALDEGGDDVFLSPREMRQVFHRDRVAVRITGNDRRGRPEGRVVDVLERGTESLAGRYVREAGVGFVIPDNPRITQQILIPEGKDRNAHPGVMVEVSLVEPPTRNSPPIGEVTEILGEVTEPGMETEVAIRSHGLPHRFERDVLAEADTFGDRVSEEATEGRYDLTDIPLVTIDGADARDFDDAVYCRKDGKNFSLVVAIADVSAYVTPDSALDREAQTRGTSVYFPTRVIPMLPEALSNGLCSLNPDVERLCMVCEMSITPAGNVVEYEFYRAVMRSHARLTYSQVHQLLWQGDKALRKKHSHLLEDLENLRGVYEALAKARVKRGAVDLDIPSSRFTFDKNNHPTGVERYDRNDAHRLIEECMITANVAAANYLRTTNMPALFRNHAPPGEEKYETLRTYLAGLGMRLPAVETPKPASYQRVALQIAERPDARAVNMMLLRSMMQAEYAPNNAGHFGLGLKEYAHFTSPIRRYPDLLVHRAIGHAIARHSKRSYPYTDKQMVQLGQHCSRTERRAEEAVREVNDWLKCEVMLDHVGDEFDGVVVAVTEFGLFVELTRMNIEGLVHITSLGQDYFKFDGALHRLVGSRSGISFGLADKMRVRVAGVSMEDRKIDFEPANKKGGSAAPRRGGRKRRGKG